MLPNKLMIVGSTMLALGMIVAVLAANVASNNGDLAFAGEQDPCATVEPDPSASPDPTADPTFPIITSFGEDEEIDCNPPGGAPDLTPSVGPTNTPAPDPTSPPPPAPSATPSGGAGAGIAAPNTGSGSSGSGNMGFMLFAGLLLALGGGGLVAMGARSR